MTEKELIKIIDNENDNQNNPHHHLNIKDHTLAVVDFLKHKHPYNPENLSDIMIAAYLHDIGKKRSKGINTKTGFDTFYNHAKIGCTIIEEYKLNIPELSKWLILHHDDRMFNKSPDCNLETFILLGDLMLADLEAQNPNFKKEEKIKEFEEWFNRYKPS